MTKYLSLFLVVLTAMLASADLRKEIPLEHFSKHAAYNNVKISPDGESLAASVTQENKTILVILNMLPNHGIYC